MPDRDTNLIAMNLLLSVTNTKEQDLENYKERLPNVQFVLDHEDPKAAQNYKPDYGQEEFRRIDPAVYADYRKHLLTKKANGTLNSDYARLSGMVVMANNVNASFWDPNDPPHPKGMKQKLSAMGFAQA